MAQATFVQDGKAIDYTPGSAVASGAVVVQGSLVGIAKVPIAASALGALAITGIFDVAKAQEAFASVGGKVYWDANGDPYGGVAGSGAATATASSNTMMGFVVKTAAETDSTVRILLLSAAAAAEALGLANLSDVTTVAYDAGKLLVADGTDFDAKAVSGDATLAGSGALTLNAAHAQQMAVIPIEDLAAGADIAARPEFVAPAGGCTLVLIGILTKGAPAGVDDSNTSVVVLKDDGANTIVSKTYNTATQPPTSDYESLGALDATHKVLGANEHVTLAITNGASADLPGLNLVIVFEPTNV